MWVGAKSGLYRYDRRQKDFQKFAFDVEVYPYYIHQESDTSLLLYCDTGVYLFYKNSARWQKIIVGIDHSKMFAAIRGKNHDLWIGSDDFIRKFNMQHGTFQDYYLPKNPGVDKISVHSFFMDSRDQLWINTWFKGLVKFDTHTGTMQTFDAIKNEHKPYLLGLFSSSMVEDQDGNVWIASFEEGLNIWNSQDGSISHIPKGMNFLSGLVGNGFDIMTDREKNMWVTSNKALHFLDKRSPVPELMSDGMTYVHKPIWLHNVRPDQFLFGTFFGLFQADLTNKKVTNLNTQIMLPSKDGGESLFMLDILYKGKEDVWIATRNDLRHVKLKTNPAGDVNISVNKIYDSKPDFWPSRLIQFNDSILVIKGRTNTSMFATFNTSSGKFYYHTFPDSILINQIVANNRETILMGIRNRGLYHYNLSNRQLEFIPWKFKNSNIDLLNPIFLNIVPLQSGNIALCMENYGLIIYDPDDHSSQHIDISVLANTNKVYSVEEDAENNLLIQTSNQLLFYDTRKKSIAKINLSHAFNGEHQSYFVHEGKDLFTAYEGGLYRLNLNQLFTKTEKPALYLEGIKAGDRVLSWDNQTPIKLNYTDNFLSFDFIGIDYDNPVGINYWYQIPEISEEWISIGNATSVSIGRMSPGRYRFNLKASNDAGLFSEIISGPEIRIRPPFWKTWWFVLGIVGIFGLLAEYLLRLRRNKRASELQLRNQIARDLHDDIGSTLSGIKIFSTIASGMAEENKDLASLLHQIRDKSDTMMTSMSDIVWSINPAYDSLHDMMTRLKQYMSEVLESQNIEVHYTSHTDLKTQKVEVADRKELYLAMKEIINNVAKHSKSSLLRFHITKVNGEIIFLISDNGIGINGEAGMGNGLKNIESRILQIGGKLNRESAPGMGTRYEIRIKAA